MTKTKEEENKQNEENRENAREFASLQMQQLQQMQQFKTEQEQEVEALQQQLAKATGLLAETEEDVEHRRAELEEEVSKLSSENEKLRSSLKNASESEQALSAAQKKDKLKIQDMEKEMYLYTETLKKKEQFIQELQFQLEDVEASMNVDMVSPEEFEKVSEANKSLQSNLDAVKEKIQAERDLYKEHVQQLEEHMKALQSAVDGHEMERSKTVLAQEYLYDANQQLLKAESAWAEAEEKEMALRARLQSAEQREEQNRQTGALEAHVRELELQVARMKTQQEQDAEKEKVQDNMEALAAIAINEHPIYGKQLLDTGYKSVYATPIRNLIDPSIIPIWEKQRSFRVERADRIAKAIARKDDGFVFPGTIVIYSFDKEGLALEASRSTQGEEKEPPLSIAHGVLDGQHRIGAIRLLVEQGLMDPETPVLTEVFSINTQKEAAKLFREINQAEPVKLVDIPEDEEFDGSSSCGGDADSAACTEALAVENAIASSRVLKKEIIDGAVNQLVAQYPDMFKPSSRCRKPHLNIDNLRDELYQSNILETIGLTTDEELYQWMEARNTELQNLDMQQWYSGAKTITNTMEKAYSKSLHHKFFLGMGYGWLYK